MNEINQILKNLGLNSKEIKIYLALLELGTGTIQQIAGKAKITRTNVYDHLENIKNMGFISEIKHDKKTLLISQNPQILEQKAEKNLENINQAMPELLGIFNTPATKPKITFYEGKQGLKQAYEFVLKTTSKTIYAIMDADQMVNIFGDKYAWEWASRRSKNAIKYFGILKEGKQGNKAKKLDQQQNRQTRLVKNVKFSTEILIFDNKVVMMSYKKPYSATIIENIAIADTMKAMWQGWWNSLK